MMRPDSDETILPPKLEAVLAALCLRLGPLTTTKAVKLPYLVDVLATNILGRALTEGTHQTWDYGVVTREVYQAMKREKVGSRFRLRPHDYSESGMLVELVGDAPRLAPEEEALVQEVAKRFGHLDAESLGALTKSLNTELGPEAWGQNHKASLGEDAFLRMSPESQALHRLLPALDLDDPSKRGPAIDDPRAYLRQALGGNPASSAAPQIFDL